MKIAVIGIGYVGLVTGLVFANQGHEVICLEKQDKIRTDLANGHSHIYEPGIEELLRKNLANETIRFTPSSTDHLAGAQVIFICVNTPTDEAGINFDQLTEVLTTAGRYISSTSQFVTVVIKSTVIPGTTANLVRNTLETVSGKKCNDAFGIASNPEFLREGHGIDDFFQADRIVIGAEYTRTIDTLLAIYDSWSCEKVIVNSSTAEFIKYYNNLLLSTLISFSNEMANIARIDKTIDFRKVLNGALLDHRLSPKLDDGTSVHPEILSYLVPGPGFGGSCLPKDLEAFIEFAKMNGTDRHILESVIKTNQEQVANIVKLMRSRIDNLPAKRILILGISTITTSQTQMISVCPLPHALYIFLMMKKWIWCYTIRCPWKNQKHFSPPTNLSHSPKIGDLSYTMQMWL